MGHFRMKKDLDLWVKYISERSIPMFNCTVKTVLSLSSDEQVSLKTLADTVLRDAVLTSRVLQIANSAYYNRSQKPIANLRRAILFLGFNKIYEICLTVALIDELVNQRAHQHVIDLMSKSFHAAIQARTLAEKLHVHHADEIFVATLFYRLGEIAFWSLSGKVGDQFFIDYPNLGYLPEAEQESLLGVTFKQITYGLLEEWKLSKLLQNTLLNPHSSSVDAKCIHLGLVIADNICQANFPEKQQALFALLEKETSLSKVELFQQIKENILLAEDTFQFYRQSACDSGRASC